MPAPTGSSLVVPGTPATPGPSNGFKKYFSDLWTYIDGVIAGIFPQGTGVWQTYVPVVGNVTLGTGGTATGRYTQIGKTVFFEADVTLGTGGAVTGAVIVGTPSNILTASQMPLGNAFLNDASTSGTAAIEIWPVYRSSATQLQVRAPDGTPTSGTAPWTWAVGDKISVHGWYEAA